MAKGVIEADLVMRWLETVSTGMMKDLEALKSMKVNAVSWVLGERKLGWSTS